MFGISIWQLLIILAIIVLIFGTKKLKNMGQDLGSALKGFKNAVGEKDEKNDELEVKDVEFSEVSEEKISQSNEETVKPKIKPKSVRSSSKSTVKAVKKPTAKSTAKKPVAKKAAKPKAKKKVTATATTKKTTKTISKNK